MLKKYLFYIFIPIFISFGGCEDEDNSVPSCIENMGPVVSQMRSLEGFQSISLNGIGNVFINKGTIFTGYSEPI